MSRFQVGDMALTIDLTVSASNGHVVRVLKVLGPIPERQTEFGYEVERLDGQPFQRVQVWPEGKMIDGRPRDVRVHALRQVIMNGGDGIEWIGVVLIQCVHIRDYGTHLIRR